MAENDAMEGKKLELHMFEQKILEAIEIAKEQKSDTGVIENGQIPFEIRIEKVDDKKIKVHAFGEEILTLEDADKFSYNIEGLKNIQEKLENNPEFDYKHFGLPDIEYLEELEKQREEEQKDEKDLSEDIAEKEEDEPENDEDKKKKPKQKEESEQEKMKKDSKNWQEMDLDREFTDTDTLRKWIKDILHESPERVYRRQTGAHDFEYMAENNGEYKPLELSTDLEGKNTRQEVYIVKEDGTLELDEVDSLLLTKDGTYGIATKVPDGVSTDMTKSFSVTRTKDGKYLATQLIEKSGQNRDPKLPGKDVGDRTQSVYEKEDFIEQKEEIDNNDMDISEDGVTVDEIGLYEYFKKKGYTPDAIDRMIKDIEENEISTDEAENNEKEANKNNKREEGGRGPWDGPLNRRDRW